MKARNSYKPGDWYAVCDLCGRDYYASELRKRWDGMMCCSEDWEPRQPQDFVRGVPDNTAVPWARLDSPEEEITEVTGITTLASGVFSVYATGSGYTITLPLASSVTGSGEGLTLQTGPTAINIILARQGADKINNATSINLNPNTKYILVSDNATNWITNG